MFYLIKVSKKVKPLSNHKILKMSSNQSIMDLYRTLPNELEWKFDDNPIILPYSNDKPVPLTNSTTSESEESIDSKR